MISTIRKFARRNGVALLALYVALGGVAWAAATVGSSDIKKNAVRAKHLKTGSVGAADINPGEVQQRVSGSCPERQAVSSVGQDGAVTCVSTDGPTGPTVYWEAEETARILSQPPGTYGTVMTLQNIPAGSYLITAHADAVKFDDAEFVRCLIHVAGIDYDFGSARVGAAATNGVWLSGINVTAAVTQPGTFNAELRCRVDSGVGNDPYVEGIRIEAIQAGSLIQRD